MINFDALIAEIHDALDGREYAPEVLNNILFGNQTDCPCVTKFKEGIWEKLDKYLFSKAGPLKNTDAEVCKALLSVQHTFCYQCASLGN